jgi:hypothetical protein
MKPGDRVRITKAHKPFFKVGDEAILIENTGAGWDADFTINDEYYGEGYWFITDGYAECELIEENN